MRAAARVVVFLLSFLEFAIAQDHVTPFLDQSFFFDWDVPGQPLPTPITAQCDTINITWSRSTATGPNPTAPYYLQVYTSVYLSPLIIEVGDALSYGWAVPFAPGTQYQICMFDKFGNTGGCQATYTVIPPTSTPTCGNVTFPPQLGVAAVVDNGPMSQYGWVDQCTDIQLTPTNGTAPFTLTVAPALHPPYNITVNSIEAINWTVSLNWASPFFISLVDGTGASWANGPLHAGGGGTIECLAGNVTTSATKKVSMPIAIGSGVGGLAVGFFVGVLFAYVFLRWHLKRKVQASRFVEMPPSAENMFERRAGDGARYRSVPTTSTAGVTSNSSLINRLPSSPGYQVEAFTMPDEHGRAVDAPEAAYSPPARITSMYSDGALASVPRPANTGHVYVVHHDGSAPPVTIYTQEGTDVVELPPRYPPYASTPQSEEAAARSASASSRSDARNASEPLALHQVRQPGQLSKRPRSSGQS
ncbi:hypothetical protein HYPSUDRAFT_211195 [Hypholoma sublateritium FD-334 SS-4]|uniref:Fibronectin type-III domain-containing protein n=1 Tax=Hypholoma sublateritium (strain FD-334 SS-4) TaxID=945553 RepID=A0A0D2PLT4_HYPSF|nr:hypothetical protein HYPSUDRAFT_211195 [Hypholoma sublateritium FD-334 SS-4]